MDALDYLNDLVPMNTSSNRSNLPIADYLEEELKRLNFETERIEYEDSNSVKKASIVAKKGKGTGGMAYFGHTDTVPADTWFTNEHGPFEPTIKGSKLYGRGVCDMKGSISCMLSATNQLSDSCFQHPLYITLTSDEEIGYGGAAAVANKSQLFREMVAGRARGVIGEPTMLEVVHAHKGTYGFIATSYGKAAHSSRREGLNANLAMIPFLSEMKLIHDEVESVSEWQNDEFDPPGISWNIGINDHTRVVNMKAAQSICTVYFRPMAGMDADALIERARRKAQEYGIEFNDLWKGKPLYVNPESDFIQEALALAGKHRSQTVAYGTDGAMLTDLERLAVIGPGDIAQAHTHDEWITIEQINRGAQLFTKMIRHWCGV